MTGEVQVRLPEGNADAAAAEALKALVRSALAPFVTEPAAVKVPIAAYDPNVTPPLLNSGYVRLASVAPASPPSVPSETALQSGGVVGPPLPFAGAYYEYLVSIGRIVPYPYAFYQPWTASYAVPAWAPASFGAPTSFGVPASYGSPGACESIGAPSVPCGCSCAAETPAQVTVPFVAAAPSASSPEDLARTFTANARLTADEVESLIVASAPTPAKPYAATSALLASTSPVPAILPPSVFRREAPARDAAAGDYYFGEGFHEYWSGRFEEAEVLFDKAVAADPEDARFWFYRGFALLALERRAEATNALGVAVRLERAGSPSREVVSRALERVQGPLRSALAEARRSSVAAPADEIR